MTFIIYVICLGVGFVFTIGTAMMGHIFGGGHGGGHVDGSHGHVEAGADASDMPGVSAFSPTVIAAFITAFGGLGIIFSEIPATKSPWLSAPLSVAGAFIIAGGLLAFLRQLFKHTQSSSESKVGSLVGQSAIAISPIPENGVGEIAYVQGGTRYTAPAREINGASVSSGKSVTITKVTGSQFYVTLD
jgi:membrane-bound ClpP family serine protease